MWEKNPSILEDFISEILVREELAELNKLRQALQLELYESDCLGPGYLKQT